MDDCLSDSFLGPGLAITPAIPVMALLTSYIVKVRLQSQPTDRPLSFAGPLDCFQQTYRKEGVRGLYRVSDQITDNADI